MQSHKTDNYGHRHFKKDDADRFRETSLRAIRRRKVLPKIIFCILSVITIIVVAFAIYAYNVD